MKKNKNSFFEARKNTILMVFSLFKRNPSDESVKLDQILTFDAPEEH